MQNYNTIPSSKLCKKAAACQKERTNPGLVKCPSFTPRNTKEEHIKRLAREEQRKTNKRMKTLICLSTAANERPYQNVYFRFQPSIELENRINALLESY